MQSKVFPMNTRVDVARWWRWLRASGYDETARRARARFRLIHRECTCGTCAFSKRPRITMGRLVTAKAFTNCFGVYQPEVAGLTVVAVRIVRPTSATLRPYRRITAARTGGPRIDAAERHFALD